MNRLIIALITALSFISGAATMYLMEETNQDLTYISITVHKLSPVPIYEDDSDKEIYTNLGITQEQYQNLKLANELGEKYDLSLTLMAIMIRETRAGKFGPVGDESEPFGERSYGLMQVKVATANHVFNVYPEIIKFCGDEKFDSKEELISKLINDKYCNVSVALGYLRLLKSEGLTWREMVTAYNRGIVGYKHVNPDVFPYTTFVINSINDKKDLPVKLKMLSMK